jgi:hypothetical protein
VLAPCSVWCHANQASESGLLSRRSAIFSVSDSEPMIIRYSHIWHCDGKGNSTVSVGVPVFAVCKAGQSVV